MRRLWAWFVGLRPWQRVLIIAAAGVALLQAWDLAGLLLAGALDVDRIAGRARGAARRIRRAGRQAKAATRTADAAGELLDAVGSMADAHREADAKADAELAELRAGEVKARDAKPPADDLEPLRLDALEGE